MIERMSDIDAEKSVLSCMLFDRDAVVSAQGQLSKHDFYAPYNQVIFETMLAMQGAGSHIDVITVKNQLIEKGLIERVGGIDYLVSLIDHVFSCAYIDKYVGIVRRYSESRKINTSITELLKKPLGADLTDLRALIRQAEEDHYVSDIVQKAQSNLERFKADLRQSQPRIKTGLPTLDAVTGGLRLGTVCTIGAYPSTGKTMLALNIASNQALPIVVFSLEMTSSMIIERLAAANLMLDYGVFNHRKFTPAQIQQLDQFADCMKHKQVHVFDDIRHVERQADIITKIKPCMVIVDYIQKVGTHKKYESKRLEIEHISGMYKQIANQNNCLVLLLSQVSRPEKYAKSPRPSMQSLKESGGLEADSDMVLMLYRPHVLNKDDPKISPQTCDIVIAKNKFGLTGKIDLNFDGKHQLFTEAERGRHP